MARREDHLEAREAEARRALEHHARRWPLRPTVYLAALLALLVLLLLWAGGG